MNKFLRLFTLLMLTVIFVSCEKETITNTVVAEPTVTDIQKKLVGSWKNRYIEQEIYSGNVMTKKMVITSALNAITFRSDSTYTSVFETQPAETGTWELLSNSYLHLDKGRATDRYFHIITLDAKTFVYRGPFDAAGNIKFGYLLTSYDFR